MKSIGQKVDDSLLLHTKVYNIESCLSDYDKRLKVLEYKSIDLESRSIRNNLIFNGIPESRDENCSTCIVHFLLQHLQIENCPQIPRAHRLGKFKQGSMRPIIVYFLDHRDTVYVLSQAYKLKDTKFSVNRDFPKEITNSRKRLRPEYKRLRHSNPDSKTSIINPAKLVSNGRTVADEFPDWDHYMQSNRPSSDIVTCSSDHSKQSPACDNSTNSTMNTNSENNTNTPMRHQHKQSENAQHGSRLLRTKFVTKKEMNKCMAEIYDPGGIRTRAARFVSQYHNH